jgi:hypothetical protein
MIPLVVCLVNAIGVVVYHVRFSGNVKALAGVKESALAELDELASERRKAESFLAEVDERHRMLQSLYEEYFATEEDRLTAMIREAKSLARQAGLAPKTITYPATPLAKGELSQRQMIFPVEGTYEQLRMFMNFLELTDQFLTLEGIELDGNFESAGREPVLSVQLGLSTVFVAERGEMSPGGES